MTDAPEGDSSEAIAFSRRHLIAFFALTFAISWGVPALILGLSMVIDAVEFHLQMYSVLYYISVWSPALSAFVVVVFIGGWKTVKAFLLRMLKWRVAWYWYAAALVGIPLVHLMASGLTTLAGEPAFQIYDGPLLILVVGNLLRATAGPVEEFGWRGFALPLMQRTMTPIRAALLLGLVWYLWHVPTFFVGGFAHGGFSPDLFWGLFAYGVQVVALSVFITVVFNGTGGSLLLAFLIHWMANFIYPWDADVSTMEGQAVAMTLAAIVIGWLGRRYLRPENAHRDIVEVR